MGLLSGGTDYMPQDVVPGMRKRSLLDKLLGRGMDAGAGDPAAPRPPLDQSPDPTMMPTGTAEDTQPDRLHTLQDKLTKMDTPPTTGQRVKSGLLSSVLAGGAGFFGTPQSNEKMLGNMEEAQQGQANRNAMEKRSLESQIGEEERYKSTMQHQTAQDFETKRYHDAQMRNIDDEIANRGNAAAPTIEVEHGDQTHRHQWNPESKAYDVEAGTVHPKDAVEKTDEFERLWANDAKNMGPDGKLRKPTLADKLKFEQMAARDKHQSPEASYTPLLDDSGHVTGRWNNRTGTAESMPASKPTADNTPPPTFRKSPMPAAIANRDIQAGAVMDQKQRVLAQIEEADKANAIGPLAGRWQTIEQFMGDPDPVATRLRGEFDAYAALQPGLAGMRSSQRVEEINKRFGSLKFNKANMIAAVEGIGSHAEAVHGAVDRFNKTGNAMPQESVELERGPDGKLRPKKTLVNQVAH